MSLRTPLAIAAALTLTAALAACSSEPPENDAAASTPAPTDTAATAAGTTEPDEDEETAPAEAAGDERGTVARAGTWTEFDETTISFAAWDESMADEVDAYAAADAALDFLFLAAQHDTAFHTHTLDELFDLARDNDPTASELEAAWYFNETLDQAAERGGVPTHHISPLSLVSNTTLDVHESANGFTATGHDLQITDVTGHVHTDTSFFDGMYTSTELVGPIVGVDIHLAGDITGTDTEGTPTRIEAPFSTFSVITTRDEDGTWKLLSADTWSTDDFVGDDPADEFGH